MKVGVIYSIKCSKSATDEITLINNIETNGNSFRGTELQIRGGTDNNSKIILLISQ